MTSFSAGDGRESTDDRRRIDRALQSVIEKALETDGCALLTGPYEVGKSDLARAIARRFGPAAHYVNANDESGRAKLCGDIGLVRNSTGKLIVIDEIHSFPDGLDLIRAEIESAHEEHRETGRFLILASMTIDAERLVSKRLGTRSRTHRLSPISFAEREIEETATRCDEQMATPGEVVDAMVTIPRSNSAIPIEALWMRGGFPRSLLAFDDAASFAWRHRYIEALCARGYHQISPLLSASTVYEILSKVAATQGELFVVDRSRREEKACLDHLEDVGLIRQLRPWYSNEVKRFEKNQKVYIRDSGLLHCLLNRRTHDELRSDGNVLGHSWEGFCIENLIGAAPDAKAFFYRSEEQDEIDLVLEFSGNRRLAIEIKSERGKLSAGFDRALGVLRPVGAYVVRPVPESFDNEKHRVMTVHDMIRLIQGMPS